MDNVPPSKRLFCGRSENDREKFRYIGTIDVRIFDEGSKIPFTVGLANLLVLTGLGVYGLTRWDTNQLVADRQQTKYHISCDPYGRRSYCIDHQ